MTNSYLEAISLDKIIPDLEQPRSLPSLDELKRQVGANDPQALKTWDKLRGLATSILEVGLEQPISVYPSQDGDNYIIYDGHRRWLAMMILNEKGEGDGTISCRIRTKPQSNDDILLGQIMVNVQRDDLNVFELARSLNHIYQNLRQQGGTIRFIREDGSVELGELVSQETDEVIWDVIEKKIGIGRSRRYQIQGVLKLSPQVQKIAESAAIPESKLRLIIPIKDENIQIQITQEIAEENLSPAQIKQRIYDLQRVEMETSMPKPRRIRSSIKHIRVLAEEIATVSNVYDVVISKDPRTVASYREIMPELRATKKDIEQVLAELAFLEE